MHATQTRNRLSGLSHVVLHSSVNTMDEKPKIEILDMQDTKVDVQAMVDETVRRVREQSDKCV